MGLAVSEKGIENDILPENDYILVGILGIRDDVRPESIEAIQEVHNVGVQVVMITGDRKDTAVAIAKEAGLLTSDNEVVWTSDELFALSDDEVIATEGLRDSFTFEGRNNDFTFRIMERE